MLIEISFYFSIIHVYWIKASIFNNICLLNGFVPGFLEQIEDYAFDGCTGLQAVVLEQEDRPPAVWDSIIEGCNSLHPGLH